MADNKQLILSRADAAVLARDFSLAARLYKTLLNEDGSDLNLLMKLGDVYQKSGQNENALAVYKRIPDSAEAANEMGAIYRRMGKYEESVNILEQALVFGGQTGKIYYNLGFTYRQMKEYDNAIRCFEEVLNENPNDVLVFNHIGAIHAERGNHEKAVAAYLRGLKIDQNHPILNLNIAKSYEKLHRKANAIQSYEAALRAKPGMLEAVEGYSNLLIRENKIREAYEVVNNAVRLNPENIDMRVKLGKVYEKQCNYEKAEDQYEAALEINDSHLPALFGLADVQENQHKYDDAVRTMRRAEEMNPTDVPTLKKAAHVLMSANYLPAALDHINRLIEKDDRDVETLNLMGQYYICADDETKRDETFEKIEAIDPQYVDHWRDGAKRYQAKSKYETAEFYLNKVLIKNPQDIASLIVLGEVYEQKGEWEKAMEVFAKANSLGGSNVLVKNAMDRISLKGVEIPQAKVVESPADVSEEGSEVGESVEVAEEENPVEEKLDEESAEEVPVDENSEEETPAENDGFDFEQFGMDNLIEEESDDDLNNMVFDDDNFLDENPVDADETVTNLDDLLQDELPIEAEDENDIVSIPDGSEEEPGEDFSPDSEDDSIEPVFEEEMPENEPELDNLPENILEEPAEEDVMEEESVLPETTAPAEPVKPEEPVPVRTVEAKIAREDLDELRKLTEKAQDAMDKANYAAEKAWLAAQEAADIAHSSRIAANEPAEEETQTEEIHEEENKTPEQLLLERAVKMLPSITKVITDKSAVEQFKPALEMFKKLRELLEYLPDGKKQEFLQSETRLLLDFVIARLSGIPGLYETAKALRDGGLVKAAEDFTEEKEGTELTKKVLDQLCLLVSYIDDNNLRAALMQCADGLYEKL